MWNKFEGEPITFQKEQTFKKENYVFIGKELDETMKRIPKGTGVLFFFPSYKLLGECYE